MDIEEKQAEHIAHFVQQASVLKGPSLSKLIVDATSHPSLFAFSEILALPNILQVFFFSSIITSFYCYFCSVVILSCLNFLMCQVLFAILCLVVCCWLDRVDCSLYDYV